jgi:hypothetical protein
MWIAKSTLLGLWLLGFLTMGWLWFEVYRYLPPGPGAVSADLILRLTVRSPLWWTALVLCFALGFWIVRSWAAPLAVWIAVLVTGLIPAGYAALFVVLYIAVKRRLGNL